MRRKYASELSGCALRYVLPEREDEAQSNISRERRLVLLPLSWTGISRGDAILVPEAEFPCPVYTVPIDAACAALIRIACREPRASTLRRNVLQELCSLVAYRYFDMSYEGEYMELLPDEVPRSEKEVKEMDSAAQAIKGWGFKDDEMWMRDALVQIVKGEASYDGLPWETTGITDDVE